MFGEELSWHVSLLKPENIGDAVEKELKIDGGFITFNQSCPSFGLSKWSIYLGGAVAEWSKALLVRENKRKSKRSQVRPPDLGTFKKSGPYIRFKEKKPTY